MITKIGSRAANILSTGIRGEIGAIFEHSFYIVVNGHWVCLLPTSRGIGPLNAICVPRSLQQAMKRLRNSDNVTIANTTIYVGSAMSCSFAAAEIWNPPRPVEIDARSLTRGLAALSNVLKTWPLPRDGLANYLTGLEPSANTDAFAAAARQPMCELHRMLAAAISAKDAHCIKIERLAPLLGMGVGLTPSGDDAISGAMIALHLLGCDWLRDALWSKLRLIAASSTGKISYAHLEAAADGAGHEALHGILNSILGGDTSNLDRNLMAIDAIGHTSGWDALAGSVTAFKAWMSATISIALEVPRANSAPSRIEN